MEKAKEYYLSYRPFEEFIKNNFKELLEEKHKRRYPKKYFTKEGKEIKK